MNHDPIIRIEGLSKTFVTKKATVHALKDINLEIMPGDIYGIIGMSGAGKSTLVRCMNLLERPTGGKVIFDGTDITKLSRKALAEKRQSIGMIFQQFNLLMQRNVEGNIVFPLEITKTPKEEAVKRALELMEIVDLAEKRYSYPSELSGGQKQRVAIARALATNPKVLLCDEATSALDPKTTRAILRLLKDINKKFGITIVVITHEMAVIEEICTKVAIIADSKIAEHGDVTEIFANPKTDAARRLVYPDGAEHALFPENKGKLLRITFDGRSSYEPVIANMVLDFRRPINIMYADTRDLNGGAVGQMIIQLPDDSDAAERMKAYLNARGINNEEVSENVR